MAKPPQDYFDGDEREDEDVVASWACCALPAIGCVFVLFIIIAAVVCIVDRLAGVLSHG